MNLKEIISKMSDKQVLEELKGVMPEDPEDPRERLRLYTEYKIDCDMRWSDFDYSLENKDNIESRYLRRLMSKLKITPDKNGRPM